MAAVSRGPGVLVLLRRAGIVALGGVVGTAGRAALETAAPAAPGAVPWTTLGINVVGSFLLGILLEVLARRGPDEGRRRTLRLLCGTGILGGFTTYSTFAAETEALLSDGAALTGVGYAVASVVIGVCSAVVGIVVAKRLGGEGGTR